MSRPQDLRAFTLEGEAGHAEEEEETRGRLRDSSSLIPTRLAVAIRRIAEERFPVGGICLIGGKTG